jgi:hypothetical protein
MLRYVIAVTSEQYQFPSAALLAVPLQSCPEVLANVGTVNSKEIVANKG